MDEMYLNVSSFLSFSFKSHNADSGLRISKLVKQISVWQAKSLTLGFLIHYIITGRMRVGFGLNRYLI